MKKIFLALTLLVFIANTSFSQTIVEDTLNDCTDCIPYIIEKNWPAAIGCAVTAAVGAIIRYFEKRKMLKNAK